MPLHRGGLAFLPAAQADLFAVERASCPFPVKTVAATQQNSQ
ncbi:hypothetical protein QUB28_02200 [Microcoleus sp. B4-C3]